VDLDVEKLAINYVEDQEVATELLQKKKQALEKRKKKVSAKKIRDIMKKDLMTKKIKTFMILQSNDDFNQMRESYTDVSRFY
jgi:hypothetical protein